MISAKEIREKETDHLKHELVEKRKHLFDLRSQAVTEKLEDPSQLRKTRTEIARMQTVLRQRELEKQKTAEVKTAEVKTAEKKPAEKKTAAKAGNKVKAAAK